MGTMKWPSLLMVSDQPKLQHEQSNINVWQFCLALSLQLRTFASSALIRDKEKTHWEGDRVGAGTPRMTECMVISGLERLFRMSRMESIGSAEGHSAHMSILNPSSCYY